MKRRMTTNNLAKIYVILTIFTCFSILYGWVPVLHSQAYLAVVSILFSILIVPRYFLTPQFLATFFYAAIVWINAQRGDGYCQDNVIMDGLMLCMVGSMSYYLMKSDDQKIKKLIVLSVVMIYIIQTVPSIVIYMTSSDSIRMMMEQISHNQTDIDWSVLHKLGVLDFYMIHSMPMLVPPLMMWLRNKNTSKKIKFLCLLCIVCMILLSIVYDVTTVLFLVVFGIITSLLIYPGQNKRTRQRIVFATILILAIMLNDTLQRGALSIAEKVTSGSTNEKIAEMRYNLIHDTEGGDMYNRTEYYALSLGTFFKSPIIGTDEVTQLGMHSSIFDRMGALGIVGSVPYILIIIICISLCWKSINKSRRWYYVLCTIGFVTLLIMKNVSRVELWLMMMVVAPAVLSLDMETFVSKRKKFLNAFMK